MKKVILSVAIIAAIGFTSCTSEKKTDKEEVQKSEMDQDKMAVAEYQCPMKCEDEKTYTDKDHSCPVCKMDLKEVKQEDGKNSDMDDDDKKSEENHNHEEGDDKH